MERAAAGAGPALPAGAAGPVLRAPPSLRAQALLVRDRKNYRAYRGPCEWHTYIVGQYLPEKERAGTERAYRAMPSPTSSCSSERASCMGRMLSSTIATTSVAAWTWA